MVGYGNNSFSLQGSSKGLVALFYNVSGNADACIGATFDFRNEQANVDFNIPATSNVQNASSIDYRLAIDSTALAPSVAPLAFTKFRQVTLEGHWPACQQTGIAIHGSQYGALALSVVDVAESSSSYNLLKLKLYHNGGGGAIPSIMNKFPDSTIFLPSDGVNEDGIPRLFRGGLNFRARRPWIILDCLYLDTQRTDPAVDLTSSATDFPPVVFQALKLSVRPHSNVVNTSKSST